MKLTIFTKIALVIFMLLISTLSLYYLTNQSNVRLIKQEIQKVKLHELAFLAEDIDNDLSKISSYSNFLVLDNDIKILSDPSFIEDDFELNKIKQRVSDKLNLLHALNNENSDFTVFYTGEGYSFSSMSPSIPYSTSYLQQHFRPYWQYHSQNGQSYLSYYLGYPYTFTFNSNEVSYVIEARIDIKNTVAYLERVQGNNLNGPFLYSPSGNVLTTSKIDKTFIMELTSLLGAPDQQSGNQLITIHGLQYLVTYASLNNLKDWYAVDFTPITEVLHPIYFNQQFYYFSTAFLLVFSVLLSVLLYRDVQIPIKKLIWGVKKITSGQYAITLHHNSNNEFHFLFDQFNVMSKEIKDLIEKVYMEQIRLKESKLRLMHSQIQPHFLYNSLAFIKSMTELNEKQAVIDMSMNLSRYFRNSIKFENTYTTLREELQLVEMYLNIQSMQMDRFIFSIEVESPMLELQVPRLILQPLAENAILHGIESLRKVGKIRISGFTSESFHEISVEDNGIGVEASKMPALKNAVYYGTDQSKAWALNNVYERLVSLFGADAHLELAESEMGGLKVTLRWKATEVVEHEEVET